MDHQGIKKLSQKIDKQSKAWKWSNKVGYHGIEFFGNQKEALSNLYQGQLVSTFEFGDLLEIDQ